MGSEAAWDGGKLPVALYRSRTVQLPTEIKRISVANPGIADILILRSRELYVVGKTLGSTNIAVWDKNDRVAATLTVEVTHDLEGLKYSLHQLLPDEDLKVHSAQEQIVLSGQVSSVEKMSAAQEVAKAFLAECIAPDSNVLVRTGADGGAAIRQGNSQSGGGQQQCKEGKVVNLMTVGGVQQVMLEVKVAEINRDVLKRLDTNLNIIRFDSPWTLGAVNGGATFPNVLTPDGLNVPIFGDLSGTASPVGPFVDVFEPNTPAIGDTGAFFSYLSNEYFLQAAIEASRRKGLAKILAEPTLTALTGQEAQFLSGGEFPIPVPQNGGTGTVTIEFKEFGVGVRFLPVVIDAGRINLKLNVSVSELSNDASVILGVQNTASTFVIPSLTKRSAGSTVELADGQTIGIAGLINDNTREFVDKLPGLGDVPVLGALFRSQEFRSGQTELVIFVTPRLARPISPQMARLPTDSFVPPSDLEFYLLGRMEGNARKEEEDAQEISAGGTESNQFGHQL